MPTQRPLDIAIVGAGPTGLTAALLLADDGHRVIVLDADPGPDATGADGGWQRRGVSQYRLPHVLMPRWYAELTAALPGLREALLDAGAEPFNQLRQRPAAVLGGVRDGDEAFDTLAIGRPGLEHTLGRLADGRPGIELRRGRRVTGLLGSSARVTGVRTDHGDVAADLVLDCSGRHTALAGWVAAVTGRAAASRRPANLITFHCRWFHSVGGPPPALGPMLTHHGSFSLLRLPAGRGRYAVVVAVAADARELRQLRRPESWAAVVRCTPEGAAWLDHGRGVGPVQVHAGEDVVGDDVAGDAAPLPGLVAAGDAVAVTNPLLGRGLTLGALAALTLRDALRGDVPDADAIGAAYAAAFGERVAGLIRASVWLTTHRHAQLRAEAAGGLYRTDDPAWAMSLALQAGADRDPLLPRAATRIAGVLAQPAEVFADPEIRSLAAHHLGERPAPRPSRAEVLAALAAVPSTSPTVGEEQPTNRGVHHVQHSV